MLKTLQLVRGAVSTKDMVPVLTHFHIYDGRIQGANGRIAIDAPINLKGVDVTVPAERFLRAVDSCDKEPKITISEEKLTIKSGKFRAVLPLADHTAFPRATRDGDAIAKAGELLPVLRKLRAFVSDDASRPWSNGILLKDGYAYATNNVVLARVKTECAFGHPITIPIYALDELLRINQEPTAIHISDCAMLFELGDAWLRTALVLGEWPDIAAMFDAIQSWGDPIPKELRAAVERVLPFCPDSKFPAVRFSGDGVSTDEGAFMAEVGGIDLPEGRYRAEVLLSVLAVAATANFAAYPNPIGFAGSGIEGIFVGLRT